MKEQTLTLRHLSGYLPYGLKCRSELRDNDIFTMNVLGINSAGEDYSSCRWGIGTFKPLLIPLSELTDQQWVEVFKAGCAAFDDGHITADVSKEWVMVGRGYDIASFDFRWLEFKINSHMPSFNQLSAFNKLYELHADLENLIENGLALNKNTYGK